MICIISNQYFPSHLQVEFQETKLNVVNFPGYSNDCIIKSLKKKNPRKIRVTFSTFLTK